MEVKLRDQEYLAIIATMTAHFDHKEVRVRCFWEPRGQPRQQGGAHERKP
jgi:hypothetical protein